MLDSRGGKFADGFAETEATWGLSTAFGWRLTSLKMTELITDLKMTWSKDSECALSGV
jgi:hypothetical protein